MNCYHNQSNPLQALENGVLKLWDDLARAKANANNNNRVNTLLLKVDELAILIMEMNDVDQKCCSCSSLEITPIRPPICQPSHWNFEKSPPTCQPSHANIERRPQNCQPSHVNIETRPPICQLSPVNIERRPQICQPAPVIQFPALPSQTPSYIEEYPDLTVIIAAIFVLFIAYQMFKFILGFLSEIFRRPC